MCVVDAMAGHHFQGLGHSHGHQHFHSRAMHLELDQPGQLETRGPIVNAASESVHAAAQIMARVNDLNEKPVSANTVAIALGVW